MSGEAAKEEFNQFGEVFAVDGKLVLSFEDGLSEKVKRQFTQAVESNRPLLEAAFARGALVSMRFVLGEDFNPYYAKPSRETIMLLERYGILTVDHLSSVITHETTHALFRDYFEGIEVSPQEHKALAKACFDLHKATYREIGKHLQENPELLGNLRAALKPEHIRIARVLEEGAALGNLSKLLVDTTETENTTQNQCIMSGSPGQFFGRITSAANLVNADFDGDLKYLRDSQAFGDFMMAIDDFVREGSLYATAVNESGYIMTDDFVGRKRAGHGEHNGHEVYASLMDAALNYPGALQVKLADLGVSEREAVKNMLDTEWDAAAARYPSLRPLFDRSRTILNIK